MEGSQQSPPGYGRGGNEVGGPSNEQQRRDEDILHTPIIGATAEARALVATRLRLEEMQRALDERTRQRPPVSSRRQRQLFPSGSRNNVEVFRTPVLNVAAASRIADPIQPSRSEVCSRSEHCLMQRSSRIRLFLSRAIGYTVIPQSRHSSVGTQLGVTSASQGRRLP